MLDKKYYRDKGTYRSYTHCRFCFAKLTQPVIDLGVMPLAGGFLTSEKQFFTEKRYPLEISFCTNCFLLQSINVIDADILFKDYFYQSSAISTLRNHFSDIADTFFSMLPNPSKSFIVEIGCNDSGLIEAIVNKGIRTLGVDPAKNIVTPLKEKGLPILNAYFSTTTAEQIYKHYGSADIICGFNVLAHIEDMHDVVEGITTLLKKDGILVLEAHYLGKLLGETQYDMIYHEHQYYYSLITLQKFWAMYDMEVYDVLPVPIHAGSLRYYIQRKDGGKHVISQRVKKLQKEELQAGLDKRVTYIQFAQKIAKTKTDLLDLLFHLKQEGKQIVGYGASGRGTIIMNYCGLNNDLLSYVIDDAPAKQGAYTPGTHVSIRDSAILQSSNRPDYAVVFAWAFFKEIQKRNKKYITSGGKYILPLPKVHLV